MKRNIVAVGMLLLFSAVLWSCSESSDSNPEQDLSLEQSLDAKAQNLGDAVNTISNSKGFEIITLNESTKNGESEGDDDRFSASITLDDIKGLYDYSPTINNEATETKFGFQRVFEKTKDTTLFILRLPKEKADRPWKLYLDEEGDSELVNDFVITTTDYLYSYSSGFQFEYLLDSEIEVEGEDAGELFVEWSISENLNFEYEAEFSFPDGYSVGVEFEFGDTIAYEYDLKSGEDVLYKEEIEITRSGETHKKELEYSLTIGNIELVKNSSTDTIQVYRDGVLEEGAIVEVIDESGESVDTDVAFCRKGRDLKITFTDGTEVILSELLGEDTLDKLDEIYSAMYDMYFVKKLVDKVAREIHYTNMYDDDSGDDVAEE